MGPLVFEENEDQEVAELVELRCNPDTVEGKLKQRKETEGRQISDICLHQSRENK